MRSPTVGALLALVSVPFCMVLSNSLLIPVLPSIQRGAHLSAFQAGLLITAFSVTAGLVIPFGGYFSDQIGRKAVIVPALGLFGLGGLLAGLAPLFSSHPFAWLVAGRLIQGIGGGGTYQVAMALAGDIYRGGERVKVLGTLEAANGAGKVAAPIIGSALGVLGWMVPFFFYPLASWSAAAAVLWLIPPPRARGTRRKRALRAYLGDLGEVFRQKGGPLAILFAVGFVALFILFGFLSYYSDLLESFWGVKGFVKGWIMAIPVGAMALLSYLTGRVLRQRIQRWSRALLIGGLALGAAGFVLSAWWLRSLWGLTAAVTLVGVGNGLLLPPVNTLVTNSVGPAKRGLITALYGTARFFGAALGPPVFTRVADLNRPLVSWGAAGLLALALLLVGTGIHPAALRNWTAAPAGRDAPAGAVHAAVEREPRRPEESLRPQGGH
ncbi:MAG: MFS transporter [Bacillota bacterium]|nr:MFS transporter [Bacillota bacterium]